MKPEKLAKTGHRAPLEGPDIQAKGAPPIPSMFIGAVALLMGIHFFLGFGFIRSSAATYDESVHLAGGYSYLETGRYRLNIMDHPPLAEMWDSLPLLWMHPHLFLSHPDWISGRLYHYSDYFLYHNNLSADSMLGAARRFALITWTILLGSAVLLWARRVAGDIGMISAAAIYAFMPAFISNLALVTTDGGSMVFFFLTIWILSNPRLFSGIGLWALAGACVGLANAAKFNMITLGPIALLTVLLEWWLRRNDMAADPKPAKIIPQGEKTARSRELPIWGVAVFLISGLIVLAGVYRFNQFGLYWDGLSATLHRLDEGRSAFFFGRHSVTGFLLYFPLALAIKTPVAVWVLAACGLAEIFSPCPHPLPMGEGRVRADGATWLHERVWLCIPPVLYMAAAMHTKVDIGYRHVLPVIPFIVVWAACGAAWLWNRNARWGRPALAVLIVWLMGSVARVYPYYLAYFNEAVGGPSQGYRYLTDSNLDWGQDIKGLAEEVRTLGNPPVYLAYFGMADPAAYGLHYLPVGFVSLVERRGDVEDPSVSGRVLFAVSATNLQSTYYQDQALFDWLRAKTPLRVIGYSIFLYDLTGDAQAYRHLAHILDLAGNPGAAKALLAKI